MKQLHDLMVDVISTGQVRETRSGIVQSVFDRDLEFDLRERFPVPTTKLVNMDTVMSELMMFLSGTPDRRLMQEFQFGKFDEGKFDIWKGDCERAAKGNPERFNGYNLGDMYPLSFRNQWMPTMELVEFSPVLDLDSDYRHPKTAARTPVDADGFVGESFTNNGGQVFVVVESGGKNSYCTETGYIVQFCDTGFIPTKLKRKSDILNGEVCDYLVPRTRGIACRGTDAKLGGKNETRISALWHNIMQRCYSEDGAYRCSVTVSPRWLIYENFFNDVFSIPNFQEWVSDPGGWAIDKDYYSGKVYSRSTCIFLPTKVNLELRGDSYLYNDVLYLRSKALIEELGFSGSKLSDKMIRDNDITVLADTGNTLYRPKLFSDPLQEDIIDLMVDSPNSRYMTISHWNSEYRTKCVLGACHKDFQVYVDSETGEFDLSFTLRSSDLFLGSYYNCASYGALMVILGNITGLTPRYLKVKLLDCHVYEAHMNAVTELLRRTPEDQPTRLVMSNITSLKDLEGLTADDFSLEDYTPMSAIKAPLLVG